jgi:hypothetical protein
MFLLFVLFLVILVFWIETQKEGFGERNYTEKDVPLLMEQYDVIDKTLKNYARIFNDFR